MDGERPDAEAEFEFDFDFELLRELTETGGVPGYEGRVRELVRRELAAAGAEIRVDGMGNLVGTVRGDAAPEHEVVVAAHLDEIGFMVRRVDDDGFLALDPLGGWDPRVLRAQRVTVHTGDGDLAGVIGSQPPHLDDGDGEQEVHDVRVDLGRGGDAVADLVEAGDLVTMRQTTEPVGEHVTGKALDDRICVFAMLAAARRIAPDATVHFAATVQEEVGIRGAEALGVDLSPDLGIALDVTVANDVPGVDPDDRVTALGDGVAVKLKDGSVITNPEVNRRLRSVAEERGVDYQTEVLPSGGTDTAGLQTAGGATPVGALSIPTRYLHTVVESAHGRDVEAMIELLTAFLDTETGEHDYRL